MAARVLLKPAQVALAAAASAAGAGLPAHEDAGQAVAACIATLASRALSLLQQQLARVSQLPLVLSLVQRLLACV